VGAELGRLERCHANKVDTENLPLLGDDALAFVQKPAQLLEGRAHQLLLCHRA